MTVKSGFETPEVPIEDIIIGERFRKDFGSIKSLAENIMEIGLLHPVVISDKNELIAGYRRIKAYEYLLKKKIPVTVVPLEDLRRGEVSENQERKDFTVSETAAIIKTLKPKIGADAKERQGTRTDLPQHSSKLDESEKARTDETLAKYLGIGKDTLRKIETIAEEGNESEIKEADSKTRQVSRVFNKIKKRQNLEEAHRKGSPPMPEGVYDIIYADPSWKYDSDASQRGKADNHYATMTTKKIADLDVPSAENALLFLWVTNAHLEDGLRVIKAWGFKYITNFVWVKDKIGLGWFARGQHELLLLCRKGKMPHPEDHNRYSTVINAPRGEHSVKPEIVYDMIEKMYPNRKYLELFARQTRDGWTSWGLEV